MAQVSWILLVLITISAQAEKPRSCPPITESDVSAVGLQNIAVKNKFSDPEDLICCMPESYRSNFVVMINSFSAQTSSPSFARVIMFDPSKDKKEPIHRAVSFNGHKKDGNYHNTELMEFDKIPVNNQNFGFFDFNFAPEHENAQANQIPEVSSRNPPVCTQCHQEDPRPNWDATPFTPRALGVKLAGRLSPMTKEQYKEQVEALKAFKEAAKTHSRYRCLIGLQEMIDRSLAIKYRESEEGNMLPEDGAVDPFAVQNALFASRLAWANGYRVSRLIQQSPDYERYKYAILGSLLSCERKIDTFLSEAVARTHTNESYLLEGYRGEINNSKLKAYIEFRKKDKLVPKDRAASEFVLNAYRHIKGLEDDPPQTAPLKAHQLLNRKYQADVDIKQLDWALANSFSIGNLRFLMEGRGISMENWNMDVDSGSYRFINVEDNAEILLRLFEQDKDFRGMKFLQDMKPDLLKFSDFYERSSTEKHQEMKRKKKVACSHLKDRSIRAFNKATPSKPQPKALNSGSI